VSNLRFRRNFLTHTVSKTAKTIETKNTPYTTKRTSYPTPSASVVITTTLILGDGLPITGYVYNDETVVSEIVVHTSRNGDLNCPYMQPTGSGSLYISCCGAMAVSSLRYRFTGPALPEGYSVQTICPNGLTYMTTQSTPTASASDNRPTSVSEESLELLKRATWVKTYANNVHITFSDIVILKPQITDHIASPTTLFTEYPCHVPESICDQWKASTRRPFKEVNAESFGLVDALSESEARMKTFYMCSRDIVFSEPATWDSDKAWKPPNIIKTSRRKSGLPPGAMDWPCTLRGYQVTVYYYASKRQDVIQNVCDYTSHSVSNGLGLVSQIRGKLFLDALGTVSN
jgi:hypothetical protein